MNSVHESEYVETVVIGGGQAGLSVGYYLAQRGLPFVILDANERVGDPWRKRWDSLRLFTPSRYDGLAGMPFPGPAYKFITKDEMADYLESYAKHFKLPVRTGVKVEHLSKEGERYVMTAGNHRFECDNVIVAMGKHQKGKVPTFAKDLDPGIVQLHSVDYKNPSQLQDGDVLIVGAGNSGAEIAMDVAKGHQTYLSGRDTGHVPFRIDGLAARLFLARFVFRVLFHRLFTLSTPVGRKMRSKVLSGGGPLIRQRPQDLAAAGITRLPKTTSVKAGLPVLEDGRVLNVANVIWCTGFDAGFSWIDLPVFDEEGPFHERGIVASQPGLYFVGLPFLYAFSSEMVQGVGRDADHVVEAVADHIRSRRTAAERRPALATALHS
jgi:putative flavoprotein involved in K+ transport